MRRFSFSSLVFEDLYGPTHTCYCSPSFSFCQKHLRDPIGKIKTKKTIIEWNAEKYLLIVDSK